MKSSPLFLSLLMILGFGLVPAASAPEKRDAAVSLVAPSLSEPVLVVEADTSECVHLAAADLAADCVEATGCKLQVVKTRPSRARLVLLSGVVGQSALINELEKRGQLDCSSVRGKWETFLIKPITAPWSGIDQALVVVGSDKRAAMYGLYEISERAFEADPMKFWTGHKPRLRDTAEWSEGELREGPPTFDYRGLFINDEDLLIGWRGTQPNDRTLEPDIYAAIFETTCRLKGNMIAPAMYANYMDPDSRKLADARGLFYTASHLEILLANPSGHRWEDFCKEKLGQKYVYSFNQSPEAMLAFWKDSIERHKAYDNIWPIGLRGNEDNDFVDYDTSVPKTAAGRAEYVSRVIKEQRKLLSQQLGPDAKPLTTLTMRGDVNPQYHSGKLQVPEDTVLVWGDEGSFARFGKTALPSKESGRPGGNGVYYHLTYCDNQWVQWVPLQVVREEMERALNAKANRYVLHNVGDIRELPLTISGAMDMVWNMSPWVSGPNAAHAYNKRWVAKQFGAFCADEVTGLYEAYQALENTARVTPVNEAVGKLTFPHGGHKWETALEFLQRTGNPRSLGQFAATIKFDNLNPRFGKMSKDWLRECSPQWDDLYKKALETERNVSPEGRQFFFDNFILQVQTSRLVNHWAVALLAGFDASIKEDYAAAAASFDQAAQCMETLYAERLKACHGKWENWFRGEYGLTGKSLWGLRPEVHAQSARKLAEVMRQAPNAPAPVSASP